MTHDMDVVYKEALLASSAHVSLQLQSFVEEGRILPEAWDGGPDSFSAKGISQLEFEYIAADFNVLHHQPDTLTGFSATLFQDRVTGELHLAFRGSNDAAGYANDVVLALDFADALEEHLQTGAVRGFLQEAGILDEAGAVRPAYAGALNLSGHSLGGYLATWTALEYPALVNRVDTFDGAGISRRSPADVLLDRLWDALPPRPEPGFERIRHYYAEPGPEPVASALIAYRPGERVPLFVEDHSAASGNPFANHAMSLLVDSLAAYRLLAALDPTLSFDDMRCILEGASNGGVGAIANLSVAIGDALGEAWAGMADPVGLHAVLAGDLAAGRWQGMRILPLFGRELGELATADTVEGSAVRFALQQLHAFALVAPGTAAAGVEPRAHSAEWIEHRAWLLESLLHRNALHATTSARDPLWFLCEADDLVIGVPWRSPPAQAA